MNGSQSEFHREVLVCTIVDYNSLSWKIAIDKTLEDFSTFCFCFFCFWLSKVTHANKGTQTLGHLDLTYLSTFPFVCYGLLKERSIFGAGELINFKNGYEFFIWKFCSICYFHGIRWLWSLKLVLWIIDNICCDCFLFILAEIEGWESRGW